MVMAVMEHLAINVIHRMKNKKMPKWAFFILNKMLLLQQHEPFYLLPGVH